LAALSDDHSALALFRSRILRRRIPNQILDTCLQIMCIQLLCILFYMRVERAILATFFEELVRCVLLLPIACFLLPLLLNQLVTEF